MNLKFKMNYYRRADHDARNNKMQDISLQGTRLRKKEREKKEKKADKQRYGVFFGGCIRNDFWKPFCIRIEESLYDGIQFNGKKSDHLHNGISRNAEAAGMRKRWILVPLPLPRFRFRFH